MFKAGRIWRAPGSGMGMEPGRRARVGAGYGARSSAGRYDTNQARREPANRTLLPYPFFGSTERISERSNSIYNFSPAQDSRNLKLERGRSDFDIGHTFAGSFIWSPQLTRHWAGRDWHVSGTSTIYTGSPFTPRVANFSYVNGEASRPDRIRKGTVDNPSAEAWFDRTAFVPVPLGAYRFGTSGRNILDGPGTIVINTSLSRRFRFTETRSVQLRAEAFNLPNHPNLNLPENNVDISWPAPSRARRTTGICRSDYA